MHYLYALGGHGPPPSAGNKARNLHRLLKMGYRVPRGWVCRWEAQRDYLQSPEAVLQQLAVELALKIDEDRAYAVRSSANVEDGLDRSFAGQFKSVLNVQGSAAILQAIKEVWAAGQSPAVGAYLDRALRAGRELMMAVIVQEMVPPLVAGVAFSRNPMTGMDETVVEAVRGSGEALVQAGATPSRWIHKWGQWVARPDEEEIDLALIQQVVDGTHAIARAFRRDVDLEWVYDGRSLYWVQMREITALGNVPVYSSAMARDMLPGPVKPLIWSISVPLMAGVWARILAELVGRHGLGPDDMVKPFYYHTYFNMGALGSIFTRLGLPREVLEMMLGVGPGGARMPAVKPGARMIPLVPRVLAFMGDKMRFAGKIDRFVPRMEAQYRAYAVDRAATLGEQELVATIDRLFALTQETAYHHIVGTLLAYIYGGILRTRLRRHGVDPESFDLTEGAEAFKALDPAVDLERLKAHLDRLDEGLRARILGCSYAELQRLGGAEAFQREFAAFIERFGYLSNSGSDFSAVPWREEPDLVLRMITSYQEPPARPRSGVTLREVRASLPHRMALRFFCRRARRYRLCRERMGLLYTWGIGLFRPYFLALGTQLARRGLLAARDDIFYLYYPEVKDLVSTHCPDRDCAQLAAQRKTEMEACRGMDLPTLIYGDQPPPPCARSDSILHGTPTSRGCHTGPVKQVQGLGDAAKLAPGDVLVVPYSDVGWTPLFTRAGAVVSESGGILSHTSIIAREYGIPAVLSVAGACRLAEGCRVTVDGYKGQVIVHENGDGDGRDFRSLEDLGSLVEDGDDDGGT